MFNTQNTIKVMIGKEIARTGTVQITDPSAATYIADGEILVLNELDQPASALCEYIKFVQRSGNDLHFSPRIKVANIGKVDASLYAAPAEQVDYVGFNGTSGSITEIDYNNYFLHITYLQDKELWSEQLNRRIYHYMSGNATTQKDVATTFVELINKDQFAYGGYGAVKAEMLTNGTFTASSAGSFTVTNGSTIITVPQSGLGVNDAGKYAADASTMAVGDLLRIGGTTVGFPVYEIASISGAGTALCTITLNTPYQGASATVVAGNVGVMTAITSYGIKLTGLALPYVAKGLKPYRKVFYNLNTVGFTSTLITNSTRMSKGNGTYEQVADLEWFALGGDGIRNYMWHPIPEGRTDAVSGAHYNVFSLEYTNTDEAYVISGTKPAKGLVYLFIVGTHADGNQMDSLIHTATGEVNVAIGNSALEWA